MLALVVTTNGGLFVPPVVRAQQSPAAVGFVLDAGDLRFIFRQIQISQAHAGGGDLLGPGANQVNEARLPFGLRTVDGSFNHLIAGQTTFGASDQFFPRLARPVYRTAETFDPDGGGPEAAMQTSYTQKIGVVADSQPRIISNLIVDQTISNPAAVAVAGLVEPEPLGTLPIPNVAPDVGLSAPFNSMFTFFGQFFDHGLDLVNKGGSGTVFVPLQPDDPLYNAASPTNFMLLTRATNHPGPDGILGNSDDIQEATNQTTPFVDQNQTYTSHPSHQVFLREYVMTLDAADGIMKPRSTGRLIDGGGTIGSVPVQNIGNWAEVKAQARAFFGIALTDADIFSVPLLATDPYGRFLPGPRGLPMLTMLNGTLVEGDLASPVSTAGARKTGHAFLDDIAHSAVPKNGLVPDDDTEVGSASVPQPPGTYDNELLEAHFITGDGRGNENIALTSVHTVFHAEHNRLRGEIAQLIPALLTPAEVAAWHAVDGPSGWDYGERLFQAARFVTEMEYQHLVFEEFARKLVPTINIFIGDGINFQSDTNPAISAEFAHAVYRFGHSMLTETIARTNPDGSQNDMPLLNAFLNPPAFNNGGSAGFLTAAQAAGSVFQGGIRQVANELDEFVTEALRNRLIGLPLDLAVLNLARGRSEGIPPLNEVRRQLYQRTGDPQLVPYESWFDFSFSMRHRESLVNYIAAYGIHPTLQGASTVNGKRLAADALMTDGDFMFGNAAATGVDDIDLWMGGLAEKIAPFGSMLGSTFSHIFETTLENLQNADRFYYLERLDGLNLLAQLEGNSFAEIIARNTSMSGAPADVFSRPDFVFNLASLLRVPGVISDDPSTPDDEAAMAAAGELVLLPSGTIVYTGAAHVIWNGSPGGDRVRSSEGDDTLRGDAGNDRMEGGAGNDQHIGGAGDDILTDTFGDDVMKGGPGNDAIFGGSGPFDLLQGNEGHDFIVGGGDVTETFGGAGNDVIYTGDAATEAFGGAGDDWIEAGPQLDLIVGDENNQFQNDPNGGHDVLIGGKGDDDYDAEGGDDIMIGDLLGTERFEGMLGYDWVTYRGEPLAVDADMVLSGLGAPNINELRDRFDLVEGLSGWNADDILRGDSRGPVELANGAFGTVADGHVLNAAGIARIDGLAALLPVGATEFRGGNIILGGAGSDLIEGRGGDDIIDGDAWLNVQLRAPNPSTADPSDFQLVDSLHALKADVLAGPINPGDISIVRSIVVGAAGDAVDTAVFSGPRGDYTITVNADSSVTVSHQGGAGVDGRDTLRNIEQLRFSDVTIPVPTANPLVAVPNVTGASQLDATTAIVAAGLTVGALTFESSATVAAGSVISQSPGAGALVQTASGVDLVLSTGPVLVAVPAVVGLTQAAATTAITDAGLTVTTTEQSSLTVAAGIVISQSPTGGTSAPVGSAVALVVSTGTGPTIAATVSRNRGTPAAAITSPSITPPANTLLVAFVSAEAPATGANTTVQNVRNTGLQLVWTRARSSNTNPGTAEIWWAYTTPAHTAMTVTALLSNAVPASMTVMAFTGAAAAPGAGIVTSGANGAPSGMIQTTGVNSLVVGVGIDPDAGRTMTAAAGQVIVNQFRRTPSDTYWVQRTATPVATAGTSVTISSSYGAAMPDRWNLAVIEIKKQ